MTSPVAAVVITHGAHPDLPACLATLRSQVDELVVVANLPDPLGPLPAGTVVVRNPRPLGFASNANKGVAACTAPYVVIANPDAVADPDAVATLVRFLEAHPGVGYAGPEMRYPDGTWQPSRRRFPTVLGTIVRRTPLRLVLRSGPWHDAHYHLDDQPTAPAPADWLLGGFLCLRRQMLDEVGGFDEGYRLYCEDIDLGYVAHQRGWGPWVVPGAVVVHRYAAVIDARFLSVRNWWHLLGMLRFVRKHPEVLLRRRGPSARSSESVLGSLRPR